jgi:hypothetical protein
MRTSIWRMPSLLALSGVIVLVGCTNRPKLAEVKGTVTLKGKPLPKVMVEFIPDALTGQRSTGTTDENGHYTLVCDDQRPGAIIGPHRVLLTDTAIYGDKVLGRKWETVGTKDGPKAIPPRFSGQYADVAKTPFKKQVKDEPNVIDLEVTAP